MEGYLSLVELIDKQEGTAQAFMKLLSFNKQVRLNLYKSSSVFKFFRKEELTIN